ncbi:MAG: hypothetical protein JNK09_11675 [Prolixibacteraceae bacterium]|nr:hypothetical protein [Prolixibacteraceae bacterium]
MIHGSTILLAFNPVAFLSQLLANVERETLVQTIFVLGSALFILLGWELLRFLRKKYPAGLGRIFKRVKLEILLEKDKPLRPQVLTMTIQNVGKHDADIDAPVLEFRKIWTKRKFRLSGISGTAIYPMFIYPGNAHQLRIEVATFHQYDRSIKKFYWARIYVTDVEGRKWKSNRVKLRKSLVT